ncbi:protein phosphatase 1 regulatory subunit 15B [Narcine bancroftii]|uniref:protein phosphatase 1 regulatory subunit 15B n=1 Tax=Narcine bancroftii TaxID=1343680 RepID=UPI0038317849
MEDKMMALGDEEWGRGDDESANDSEGQETSPSLHKPRCSNQAIAYILGSPSADEDEGSEEEDWDDDGFGSDGSSGLSEETENLWNSLANCSDPYSLLNFQAPIKTRHKLETRSVPEPSNLQQPTLSFPVMEDFEDRLDSGFSDVIPEEPLKPLQRKCTKKVAFDEHVMEYYVSSEEIRKGPWEEYARDRCRFQKRIKEIEECVGHCFTLEHRWTVLNRMQFISQ